MHLIGAIGFLVFGTLAIIFAIGHELTWWLRRAWRRGYGVIVGYKEVWDDGLCYYPEIQFEGAAGISRFVSKYGSSEKPHLGKTVDIVVDESGESAEHVSLSKRLLFTIVPIAFGLIFITVGLHITPIPKAEQGGGGNSVELSVAP